MSEHTPLPWTAEARGFVRDADGIVVAETFNAREAGPSDIAKHIASSVNLLPELVEALQRACVYLPASSADLAATIDALIAKATA